MGFDKQLIDIGGIRLIDKTVETLKTEFEEILIITNQFDLYPDKQLKLVKDEIPDKGPLGGIYSSLKNCTGEYIYIVACDMPHVNLDYVRYMKKCIEMNPCDACVTRKGEWIEPFNGFYSKKIVYDLEKYLLENKLSIYRFIENRHCLFIEEEIARSFSRDWSMFDNINCFEELEQYLKNKRGSG